MTTIVNFEQQAAEVLTTVAIDQSGSAPAQKLASALTAQSVAQIFQTASTGDFSTALAQLKALIGGTTDPGLAVLVTNLWSIGQTFLSVRAQALAAAPLVGSVVTGQLASVAAGINVIAAAYIAAYSPPAASK